jgi:outer membrane protein
MMRFHNIILLSTVSLFACNVYAQQEGVSILSEITGREPELAVPEAVVPEAAVNVYIAPEIPINKPLAEVVAESKLDSAPVSDPMKEGVSILSEVADAPKAPTSKHVKTEVAKDVPAAVTTGDYVGDVYVPPALGAAPKEDVIIKEVTKTEKKSLAATVKKKKAKAVELPAIVANDSTQAATTSLAEDATSDAFYVSTLKNALQETYVTNPRIKAQREIFESTGETFNQAFAGWLPTISLNYNTGRRRNRLDQQWNYVDAEDQQMNIDQPIFQGGETIFLMDQANSLTDANAAQLISVTQEVMINAITAYADVVRDREILRLSANNSEVLGTQLDSAEGRFDLGEATRTDVSQSQARLARAVSDEEQAIGNLAVSEARFEEVVLRKPADTLQPIIDVPAIPKTLEETIAIAEEKNPRVITADYTEEAAQDLVNINIARLLPDVTLRAAASRSEGTGFQGVDFDSDSVLLNVNVPLYQGGAEYSRIREAKIQKSRRRFELSGVRNEVQQQAVQAWEGYRTSVAIIEAQDAAIEAAEIALEGVKQEQLYGSRTILDILDQEQELFVARVNRVRSERNRIVSLYGLLAITGQLSPETLALDIATYNPEEEIKKVKYQLIGF